MNPVFATLTAAFLFGAATPFSKILLGAFSPFQLAGILYGGAALGTGVLLLARRETLGVGGKLDWHNRLRLGFAVLFGGILGPLFLLKGLQLATAGSVSLWLVLEMPLTLFLGQVFFKDALGRWGWIGATGCLASGILLSLGQGAAGFKAGAWIAMACLCWGLDNHLTALIDGIKPLQSTFWKGLVAGAVNLSLGFVYASRSPELGFVVWGLILGALSYGASIALYIRSAQALGATRSQIIFSSAPFFGLVLSFILLRESLTGVQGLAALLFVGSLFLMFRDKHSHRHEHLSLTHVHGHRHDDDHHTHEHLGIPATLYHTHEHVHDDLAHSHPHWPDLHHRHGHA